MAGPAAFTAKADIRIENKSVRVMIMPSSAHGIDWGCRYGRRHYPDFGSGRQYPLPKGSASMQN
jgi:hypothetical protein